QFNFIAAFVGPVRVTRRIATINGDSFPSCCVSTETIGTALMVAHSSMWFTEIASIFSGLPVLWLKFETVLTVSRVQGFPIGFCARKFVALISVQFTTGQFSQPVTLAAFVPLFTTNK